MLTHRQERTKAAALDIAPFAIVLTLPFFFGVGVSFSPSVLFFVVLLGPAWLLMAIFALVIALFRVANRQWRLATWWACLAVAFAPAWWGIWLGNGTGWRLHLLVEQPYYDAQVAKLAGPQGDKLAVFDWGGYLIFNDINLVFDGSDSLRSPLSNLPPQFKNRLSAETQGEISDITPLWGHYYIVISGA
jgi:hypothetical protein